MMILVCRRESLQMAGDVLDTFLDRIPSSERRAVRGIAEFFQSMGDMVGDALSVTIDVVENDND